MKTRLLLATLLLSVQTFAAIKLPSFLSNNMVLQQQKQNCIWGWASPGKTVQVNFDGQTYLSVANEKGEWKIYLRSLMAGTSGNMSVSSGGELKIIENVIVGEVWICSGQSNMEFKMGMFGNTFENEIKTAVNENIRYVTIEKSLASFPQEDVSLETPWRSISPQSTSDCSAVAYWYGRKLYEELKVPIGLIVTSWGGTPAEAWTSFEGLQGFTKYQSVFTDKIVNLDLKNADNLQKAHRAEFLKAAVEKNSYVHSTVQKSFNDAGWKTMNLPGPWEQQGYPALDGIVVYRLNFNVEPSQAGKAAVLNMPAIDDIDSTYINGKFIGSTHQWDAIRSYKIDAGILKPGKNVLAIVVEDDGGGGGLANVPAQFNLTIGKKKISLEGTAKYEIVAELKDVTGGNGGIQNQPTVLYNAMISPLLPLKFSGVIWYQGESNADRAIEYRALFPSMIIDWRNRFSNGDFPFLFVQLSSFGKTDAAPGANSDWALLREAQQMTLSLPNTGMAVCTDVGDPGNIHPVRKREVGERLAAIYLSKQKKSTTGIQSCFGPVYKSMKVDGNKIVLSFYETGVALMAKGNKLTHFAIAGDDKKFYWADAVIDGNTIIVSSKDVTNPVAVRYAWADAPMSANLFNAEGFPASPFRTDNW